MSRVSIALAEVLTDLAALVDLTRCPPEEAAALVEEAYRLLPEDARVSLDEGLVEIEAPELSDRETRLALELHDRAVRYAEKGNQRAAVRVFREVLELWPRRADVRRDLAMAYVELKDYTAAKRRLLEALQLAPDDAWTYLVVVDLFFQEEGDAESAERFLVKARDLNPFDQCLTVLQQPTANPPPQTPLSQR